MYLFFLKDLPDDVHKRVTGKLFVSLTRVPDGKNVIISEFSSKEHVLQVNIFYWLLRDIQVKYVHTLFIIILKNYTQSIRVVILKWKNV